MFPLFFPFEDKIISPFKNFLINSFLLILIFALANIGKLMGIATLALPISFVWPVTGVALAAVLLFGYKVWPGIFLGNLLYNILQLNASNDFFPAFITSTVISSGSLVQALVGGYIIKTFSSPSYFKTVEDIFIFLVPATLLTCFIASTIGVFALYLDGIVSRENIYSTWLTFWVGDSMGIYLLTPFIVIWLTQKGVNIKEYDLEAILMVIVGIILAFMFFVLNQPVFHLYTPLALWVTYRFGLHGATLSIFLIALVGIVPTALGYGYLMEYVAMDQLYILISYLGTLTVTCLFIGAIINERKEAWNMLKAQNLNLQENLETNKQTLKEMQHDIFIKEKLASLGQVVAGISTRIEKPLKYIEGCTKDVIYNIKKLKQEFKEHSLASIDTRLEKIEENLNNIFVEGDRIAKILQVSKEHSERSVPGKIKCENINLHTLINMTLDKVKAERKKNDPEFNFNIDKQYDHTIKSILALPDDLEYSFLHFFNNAIDSMIEKKKKLKEDYTPILFLQTINHKNNVEIFIKDNGMGIPKKMLDIFFTSFTNIKNSEESVGLSIALAHDIIVQVHKGDISVDSDEGEFLEIRFTLPKK